MNECRCFFADQDGKVDHVIPVCFVDKCSIEVYDVRLAISLIPFRIFFFFSNLWQYTHKTVLKYSVATLHYLVKCKRLKIAQIVQKNTRNS